MQHNDYVLNAYTKEGEKYCKAKSCDLPKLILKANKLLQKIRENEKYAEKKIYACQWKL